MKKYLSLLRVKHYIKNFLIFLPLFFCGEFLNTNKLILTTIEFCIFSLVASCVYIFNDLLDYEKDRNHPTKKNRAIASGAISKRKAKIIFIFILIITMSIQFALYEKNLFNKEQYILTTSYMLGYLIMNILYSVWLKNIPIVDIIILSIGFLIRIYLGGALFSIPISDWLCLTILSFSMYLVLGKRRGELNKNKTASRKVLKNYTREFLDKFMYIFLTLTLVFYSLWCTIGIEKGSSMLLVYSIFFVFFIVMQYSLIIEGDSMGDPVDVVFSNKTLLISIISYAFYMGIVLYL